MKKTLTAMVMASALALGACGKYEQKLDADVVTVIKQNGKTHVIEVTKYFDLNRDGVVDARLRGKPSTGVSSTDYMAVSMEPGEYELLVNPEVFGPNDGLKYGTPHGSITLSAVPRTGTMTPAQRDAINSEYHALK